MLDSQKGPIQLGQYRLNHTQALGISSGIKLFSLTLGSIDQGSGVCFFPREGFAVVCPKLHPTCTLMEWSKVPKWA